MIGKIVEEFFEEQSWSYKKQVDKNGEVYCSFGVMFKDRPYQAILEYDFEERFLAVTAVHYKKIDPKYAKKIMKIYNQLAQSQIPFIHIFAENGLVASKYSYECLENETLNKKRIDFMLNRTLLDIIQLYPYLKKLLKNKKIKLSKQKETIGSK